ncbi:unnamed protein product [Enterobius vermicularis]|uniref:tRNA-dihydrouridine(47) synthase [NAD(P)(+)] n=1 Tax=Enterobius vermicularis TaxID=51028 RepID=A0A0N4VGG3_ENTVE|nr:unnamed protein product [Enterobius vermicularis]
MATDTIAEKYLSSVKEARTNGGVAPIKKEFLLTSEQKVSENRCDDQDSNECEGKNRVRSRKRQRGINRERGREMAKARAKNLVHKVRLCNSVISGRQCKHGEKCKLLHSVEEYLAQKPEDLGKSCYIFDQRGTCHFSYTCRFANAHTSSDLKQVKKEPASGYQPSKNYDTIGVQISLRKHKYDFTRSDEAVKSLSSMTGCMQREKLKLDTRTLRSKLYLAPLTTVGNLPFRRLCVEFGAEITCGEMGLCTSFLGGCSSEWSLLKRHPTERIFGVQLVGGYPDTMSKAAQLISENVDVDFIDVNCGCPIDIINQKGGGCTLASRTNMLISVMKAMSLCMGEIPLTLKLRSGLKEGVYTAHKTIEKILNSCPPQLLTLHPRSKEQRYTKLADWEYTKVCSQYVKNTPFWACGDVLSFQEYRQFKKLKSYPVDGVMIGRGALIKPWLFTEIKEQRDWDISSSERLEIVRKFVNYGLDHWGSDDEGVDKTRRFLLEWLSFAHRYIPVGLLEVLPQKINERPPAFCGRDDLETLLASDMSQDWIRITEMFLGKVPEGFLFIPKHNANAYSKDGLS